MGKKRKAGGRAKAEPSTQDYGRETTRRSLHTYEDVADSDDEFHLNRDEVLLGEEPESKRRRKWAEQEEFLEQSDEEILGGVGSDEEISEEDSAGHISGPLKTTRELGDYGDETNDHEDEEHVWGTTKGDIYGADAIETEEQALEEEAEALRLQRKQLESMTAADYGFLEDDWQQSADANAAELRKDAQAVVTEVLPQLQIPEDLSNVERLKLLKSKYPEFEPLSNDLLRLKELQKELPADGQSSVAQLKSRAASAYLGALLMYMSLLTSTASEGGDAITAMPASQLRDHPVMVSVLKCRQLWTSVAQLPDDLHIHDTASHREQVLEKNAVRKANRDKVTGPVQPKQKQQTRAERFAEAAASAAKERKQRRLAKIEADLADLDDLVRSSSKPGTGLAKRVTSGPGEEGALSLREAEEKAKRKKTLRFYTSQIAQKANKRGLAGRNAGGDDDIPYRERLKDRQARLNAEAEKRGRRDVNGEADLGIESDEDDRRQAQQIREEANEDDDYYDMIAAKTNQKKSDKAALAEAQRLAAMQGGQLVQEETIGEDGKRKISYAIEKNKGLTPHRNKAARNPRVKKRKKFDEKKKKLASIKPVYKGGEGRGGYGGELTGIKKGLVKSTKL